MGSQEMQKTTLVTRDAHLALLYSLKHARSGSDTNTASSHPRPRRSMPLRSYLCMIFMRFRRATGPNGD
jgi:hypothetical protein